MIKYVFNYEKTELICLKKIRLEVHMGIFVGFRCMVSLRQTIKKEIFFYDVFKGDKSN